MLVHTNGKNQHAHTYSVKPAPTKLLPSKAEIRSLVVVGSSCQLPWQLPSCNPWNISSQPPTSQRNLLKLRFKAFDPERRNGRSIGQSMDVSNSQVSNQEWSEFLIDYPNPPTCTGPGITNCSNLPDRISSDAAELTRKCSGEFDEFGVKKERARRDPLLYLQQRTRTSSF